MLFFCFILMQGYPAAEGFNAEASDAKAIEIADRVMEAMGGYEAYNNTRYLSWRFFGKRLHVWDKWTGDIRYETDKVLVLMNIHSKNGSVFQDGKEVSDAKLIADSLKEGYEAWINDSYWLVMPYKLKDSGVTLKYKGEKDMEDGRKADVLVLTFNSVGVTPDNKYEVAVPRDTNLVEEWSFFGNFNDAEPRFATPWANWEKHGNILLSADRGKYKHSDVKVFDELPESVFKDPAPWPAD